MSTWVSSGFGVNTTLTTTGNATVQGTLNANTIFSNTFNVSSIDTSQIQLQGHPLLPPGIICMWSGTTPPGGWTLCNGLPARRMSDGVLINTPDLRGRFVLGYCPDTILGSNNATLSRNAIGNVGGEETNRLTELQLPAHKHGYLNWRVRGQNDSYRRSMKEGAGSSYTILDTNGNNPSEPTMLTSDAGIGQPHNNMPPYYVLAYIMKL